MKCPCCVFHWKVMSDNPEDLCDDCRYWFHEKVKDPDCDCEMCKERKDE